MYGLGLIRGPCHNHFAGRAEVGAGIRYAAMDNRDSRPSIVVIDDDAELLQAFADDFGDEFNVIATSEPLRVVEHLSGDVAAVVADERMPGKSGTAVLQMVLHRAPDAGCLCSVQPAREPGGEHGD